MMKIAATVFVICMAVFLLCREIDRQNPNDTPLWVAMPGVFAFAGSFIGALGWVICSIWGVA